MGDVAPGQGWWWSYRDASNPSPWMRFYNSRLWRLETRLPQLTRQPTCEECELEGVVADATHVDHVVSLEAGGHPTDPANLRSLCTSHHSKKTAAVDGGFGREPRAFDTGVGLDGMPTDPNHPWNQ